MSNLFGNHIVGFLMTRLICPIFDELWNLESSCDKNHTGLSFRRGNEVFHTVDKPTICVLIKNKKSVKKILLKFF